MMRMNPQDRWHCTNAYCGCEVLVDPKGSMEGKNPNCACGAAMKKKYTSPALTYLQFLRPAELTVVEAEGK
jgi:hypothetical protein